MSKAKFAAAKELIDVGQYREARTILKTIDHPTARQWEKKLDALDVPEPDMVIEAVPKRRSGKRQRMILLIALLVIFIVALVVLRINFQNGYADAMQQLGR